MKIKELESVMEKVETMSENIIDFCLEESTDEIDSLLEDYTRKYDAYIEAELNWYNSLL